MKLCVLIPSYNESKTIGRIVKGLRILGLAVYVIDDGSADNTAQIAREEGAVVVTHVTNKGKGASLREGFGHILKEHFDAVLIMDADGQHDIKDVDSFVKMSERTNADMVIGNRMSDTNTMPYIRVCTNRFMSKLLSWMCGQYVPDSQCGFRLIKRQVLERVKLESSKYEIESELIIKAARAGFRIESVPIKTVYQGENSRINPILDTLRFIRFMLRS